MEKIYITGTGRSGTTFLIKILSFLDLDTGFNKNNYEQNICKNCNSGMETKYNDKYTIIKSPFFLFEMDKILRDPQIIIKTVIIPIRDYLASAKSRERHQFDYGGFMGSNDLPSQLQFYYKGMSEYIYLMTKYNIPTIFVDFDTMVTDPLYLYNKLKVVLDEFDVSFERFSVAYKEASETCKV
jgi:hypothetical protein